MKIPEIRKRLTAAANDLRTAKRTPVKVASELDFLVTELWRRKPRVKAGKRVTRTPMSPELRQTIRDYAKRHKTADQTAIGAHFNVNPGRVSEIMSGLRR